MSLITITASEYAKRRKVTLQSVCSALRSHAVPSNALPGVTDVAVWGRQYVLTFDEAAKLPRGRIKKYSKK